MGVLQTQEQPCSTARPTLLEVKRSPYHPLLVTGNPRATSQVINGSADPSTAVDVNDAAVPFETDMFAGSMTMHFMGLPSTQASVFAGKRRTLHWVIQGKFKHEVAVDDLHYGQEFHYTKYTNHYVCSLTPLASTCKILNVSHEGQQPEPMQAQEDARLLCPALVDAAGKPLPYAKRHKLLEDPAFTKGMMYGTKHVYTFVGWLHHMDWPTFAVDLAGFMAVDLCRWLPRGEPTLMMIRDIKAGDYMVNFACWHERIVQLAEQEEQRRAAAVKGVQANLMIKA